MGENCTQNSSIVFVSQALVDACERYTSARLFDLCFRHRGGRPILSDREEGCESEILSVLEEKVKEESNPSEIRRKEKEREEKEGKPHTQSLRSDFHHTYLCTHISSTKPKKKKNPDKKKPTTYTHTNIRTYIYARPVASYPMTHIVHSQQSNPIQASGSCSISTLSTRVHASVV